MERRNFLSYCAASLIYAAGCSTSQRASRVEPTLINEVEKLLIQEPEKEAAVKAEELKPIDPFSDLAPEGERQKIVINLPSYALMFYQGKNRVLEFPCRIGKPNSPTPIGQGSVLAKRDDVVFRYLSGAKKGQVIRYSHLDPENRTIKMPYDKMRGIDFEINGVMSGPVIHSTTDYWTVGAATSHGCIGLRIDDMLVLFDAVYDSPLPEIETCYRTLFYDSKKDDTTIWYDVYKKQTNNAGAVIGLLAKWGIHAEAGKKGNLETRMAEINERLRAGNDAIQKLISHGKDPSTGLYKLYEAVSVKDLLKAEN